ncbi:MAG: amino acid adenylation domain-containing protein [Acidimicrobiales bacterium]
MATAADTNRIDRGHPAGWNQTSTVYERDATIDQVIADRVAERPDAVAVEDDHRSLTYAELDGAASRLAGRLAPLLDGPDQCIAVLADRSIEAVVAFVAVLKAGAAFVPLDAELPTERLELMLGDTRARAVVAPAHLAGRASEVAAVPVVVLVVGDDPPDPGAGPLAGRPTDAGPTSLAYVMYTSGSSGRPKGVGVEHRGVLRYVRGAHDLIPGTDDGVLHVSQLGFDASTYEIWGALCNGARLVVHPPGRPDPVAVGGTIERHGVTIGLFPTGILHQMIDAALPSLGHYRLVMAGGDVLSPAHARRLRQAHPGTRLVNTYGPTEATVTAAVHEVGEVPPGRSIPIGRPLANTRLHVLDAALAPVAPGEAGELCIGGDGVARGYLHRPDADAERFVPDPFGPEPAGRLYRSGDLVRLLADGDLEFLGRLDDQVKIRGYRVEPGEVTAVLAGHPAVEAAAVVAREERSGHKRLVGYVAAGYGVDAFRLRRYLRSRLPEYMVPSSFVVLDELPLTANGKVDRSALPAPTRSGPGAPLSTGTERSIGELWAAVLEVDQVMSDDDFFEAGGDSLLALQLLSQIRDRLGVGLPLDAVFDCRTPAALASLVDGGPADRGADPVGATLPPLETGDHPGTSPVSIAQSQACFLSELADEALPYQAQAVLHLEGPLDVRALHRALQTIADRHEVLRTTFPKVRGTWMQQVESSVTVKLPVVDLRSEPEPESALADLVAGLVGQRIHIDRLPLVRWTLARLADERCALICVEHHLVHDGWSFAATIAELGALYRAYAADQPDPLPPLRAQYADFAAWQRAFAGTGAGRAQLDYWRRQLAGAAPPPRLPSDRPAPAVRSFRGVSVRCDLDPMVIDALRRTANRFGCTPYMVMTAAFAVFLARLSGETDVVLGSGLANRRLAGTEPMFGMFVNTVALRVDLSGDPSVATVLARVRQSSLGAFAHQELPFEEVVRLLDPERHTGHNPFYDHLFSFHDSPIPEVDLGGPQLTVRDGIGNGSSKADLNVVVINRRGRSTRPDLPDGEELSVVWDFATDLFDETTGRRMLATYLHLLEELASHPDHRISDLTLTPVAERDRLLALGGSEAPYERQASIPSVFADRVRDAPDAVAVVAGDRSLTYRHLDQASDRLATVLASHGVGSGCCVGVSDDRSPSMVVALLGVVKAGAAYVGLDGGAPASRLARLVDQASVAVVCVAPGEGVAFAGLPVTVVEVDPSPAEGPARPGRGPGPTDRAYVSFTSGSTGVPKGVEVPHRGVVRLVRGTDYVTLGPDEVVLAAAPLAFDASTFEIWGPLLNGGRLVLAPPGALSTAELGEALTTHGVTTAWFTAGIFHQMVEHQLGAVSSLRQVVAGGDVLSPSHVNRLLQVIGADGAVVNGYGPTEGTTFTCCHRMLSGHRVEGTVPIGRPIANTWVAIVDDGGEPVPDGMPGELWIGGDGLARGYLGQPGLTAERFVPNPFEGMWGDRCYRSGDRVRRRPDGAIEFLGRSDRQVKIRGHRVEPAETEAVLLEHPAVGRVFVAPAEFGRDDKRLVAYLVEADRVVAGGPGDHRGGASPGQGPVSDGDLGEFVGGVLPRYLVPAAYVWLDDLPLQDNGKVDVGRLPPPPSTWFPDGPCDGEVTPEATLARPVAGATRLETTLIAIWQEVTGVRRVGLHDDFFDLGGHSLLAVELFAAIERSIGARLPLATIFEAPTVARLARVMHSDGWDARTGSLVPLSTTGSRPPFFAVTAGDGNVVGFGPLARRLGPDQPFYVLQPFGLDSSAPLHRSVESMARHYVRQIRTVQPHGPYLLGGRCFGSLVAYEMAVRLESAGETVALLASIDSVGPLWKARRLANGVLYDPMMNVARVRAANEGRGFVDIFSDPASADEFVRWLQEPAAGHEGSAVSNYVHAAYLSRPDAQGAFPLEPTADRTPEHAALVRWTWVHGRSEMGMQSALLPPTTRDVATTRQVADVRLQSRRRHAVDRVLDWVNAATRGSIRALSVRRRQDVLRIANESIVRYRAGPLAATVVLIRPELGADGLQQAQLARWYGLEVGGVESRLVKGSHHGMLREPSVASLADCLDRCISDALAAVGFASDRAG